LQHRAVYSSRTPMYFTTGVWSDSHGVTRRFRPGSKFAAGTCNDDVIKRHGHVTVTGTRSLVWTEAGNGGGGGAIYGQQAIYGGRSVVDDKRWRSLIKRRSLSDYHHTVFIVSGRHITARTNRQANNKVVGVILLLALIAPFNCILVIVTHTHTHMEKILSPSSTTVASWFSVSEK